MSGSPRIVPTCAPWVDDPNPENWTPLPRAAKEYFRKSYQRVYDMVVDGTLTDHGFQTHFDGWRWYIRLPKALPPVNRHL